MWYYATLLYFGNYFKKDPRERAGLAASAIAAMAFSVFLLIILVVVLLFSSRLDSCTGFGGISGQGRVIWGFVYFSLIQLRCLM